MIDITIDWRWNLKAVYSYINITDYLTRRNQSASAWHNRSQLSNMQSAYTNQYIMPSPKHNWMYIERRPANDNVAKYNAC